MLLVYDARGFVQQTAQDTADDGYAERLAAFGLTFIRVDPTWMDGRSIGSIWVDPATSEAKDREAYPASIDKTAIAADGVDAAIVSGLLDGETVTVNGQPMTVEGGMLTLKSGHPGTFHVVVSHWPYADWSAVVVVS